MYSLLHVYSKQIFFRKKLIWKLVKEVDLIAIVNQNTILIRCLWSGYQNGKMTQLGKNLKRSIAMPRCFVMFMRQIQYAES